MLNPPASYHSKSFQKVCQFALAFLSESTVGFCFQLHLIRSGQMAKRDNLCLPSIIMPELPGRGKLISCINCDAHKRGFNLPVENRKTKSELTKCQSGFSPALVGGGKTSIDLRLISPSRYAAMASVLTSKYAKSLRQYRCDTIRFRLARI